MVVCVGTGSVTGSALSRGEHIALRALSIAFVADTFGRSAGVLDRLVTVPGRSIGIVGVGSLPQVRQTRAGWFAFRRWVVVDDEM